MNKSEYQEILVLEGLEAVRKRPGMYIGRIGSAGIFNMFKEIFDNSIDEYLQGKCSEIYVKKKGGGYYISDNGRGIPVNYSEKFKKTTLEIVLEILHSGGKFNKENYRFSGGLHGVGLSVVNALSEYFEICSFRDGFSYKLVYRKGKKEGKLIKKKINERVGTEIFFIPDPEILFTKELNLLDLEQFLEECSYLHKGLKIKYEINGSLKIFYNLEGIKAYLHEILDRKKALKIPSTSFNLEIKENLFELDFAGVYCEDQEETNYSIVNGIRTPLGGTHVSIIRTLWIRIINELKMNSKFKNLKFSSQDIFLDFHLFISLKYSEPIFEGQTKERLSNPELKKIISEPIYSFFQKLFQENFQLKEAILEKIHKSHNFNKSLRETKEVLKKKVFSERGILFGLAGKLTDCRSKDSSKNELFIVEGKSAG